MGLFSKLLGDAAERNEALNSLKNAAKEIAGDVEKKATELAQKASEAAANAQQNAARPASAPAAAAAPKPPRAESGDSWGEEMPAEENQYSFAGSYAQYFEMIFREDFPAYTVTKEAADPSRRTVFTLWENGRQALVVEVMTDGSSAQKIRRACEAAGTPYLRFYFDHDGWWNTRSYVVRRVKNAL